MTLVNLRDGDINLEAFVDFFLAFVRGEDDANSKDIVNLVKGNMLVLHLAPNGEGCLDTLLDFILDTHLLQGVFDRIGKLVEELMTRGFCRS